MGDFFGSCKGKVYELLSNVSFIVVYSSCVLCGVTVWALFFTACLSTSLQLIFVIERGFESVSANNGDSSWKLEWYRLLQVVCLPHILILWAFISTNILSRQLDIVYFLYSTIYNSEDDRINSLSTFGPLVLSKYATKNIAPELSLYRKQANRVMTALLAIIFIGWFSGLAMSGVLLVGMLILFDAFLIYHLYHHPFITRMFWYEAIFVICTTFMAVLWILFSSLNIIPHLVFGGHNKLFSVFISNAFCLCIAVQFLEIWCLPTAMLFLSDSHGQLLDGKNQWFVGALDKVLFFVRGKTEVFFSFFQLPVQQSDYLKVAVKLFVPMSMIVLGLLSNSIFHYLRSHNLLDNHEAALDEKKQKMFYEDMQTDFNCRCYAEAVLSIVLLLSLLVYGFRSMCQWCSEYFTKKGRTNRMTDRDILRSQKLSMRAGLVVTYASYYFVFVGIMILAWYGHWDMIWANCLWLTGGWIVLFIAYYYPLAEVFFIGTFLAIYYWLVGNESVLYLGLILVHGFTLLRHFLILYTHPPLPIVVERSALSMKNPFLGSVSMNSYYLQINCFFENRVLSDEAICRVEQEAVSTSAKTATTSTGQSQPSAAESKTVEDVNAKMGATSKEENAETKAKEEEEEEEKEDRRKKLNNREVKHKGTNRFYSGIFSIFLVFHVVLYVLTVWTQRAAHSDVSQEDEMQAVPLNITTRNTSSWKEDEYGNMLNIDKIAKIKDKDAMKLSYSLKKYPICDNTFHSLNIIDVAVLTELTYLRDPVYVHTDCSTKEKLQGCLKRYFTPNYAKPELHNKPYNWQVEFLKVSPHQGVTFYIASSENAKLVVTGVRGSFTSRDWLEDFGLYPEISALQSVSRFVPLINLWPADTVANYVKIMNYICSLSLLKRHPRFYDTGMEVSNYFNDVIKQIFEMKRNEKFANYQFLVVGHSLGGAIAGISGARTNTTSIAFEPPGMVYSKLKFGIAHTQLIHETSISIIRENDPVTLVDMHGGNVQHLTCPSNQLDPYCHYLHPITCHLLSNCYDMNYPHPAAFASWNNTKQYCQVFSNNKKKPQK